MENKYIVRIIDEDTGETYGIYDISKMEGEVKDYYEEEFLSYDEFEEDMIERGAVPFIISSDIYI